MNIHILFDICKLNSKLYEKTYKKTNKVEKNF